MIFIFKENSKKLIHCIILRQFIRRVALREQKRRGIENLKRGFVSIKDISKVMQQEKFSTSITRYLPHDNYIFVVSVRCILVCESRKIKVNEERNEIDTIFSSGRVYKLHFSLYRYLVTDTGYVKGIKMMQVHLAL